MRIRHLPVLLSLAATCACSTSIAGQAQSVYDNRASATSSAPRTSPKPLPFTPKVKNRTNDRNDGSTFEPCGEYTDRELVSLGINPATIEDAAFSDGANFRGCDWRGFDYKSGAGGTHYSQVVALEIPLAAYKKRMADLNWQPDRTVHGRTLAVATELDYCVAVFHSQESIVGTKVGATKPSPGNTTECQKAIAFASLAITKAP